MSRLEPMGEPAAYPIGRGGSRRRAALAVQVCPAISVRFRASLG